MRAIVLKKGKEQILSKKHHWIFSGAIASYPKDYEDGDLIAICSHNKEVLGWGYFNRRCSLAGRIVSFGTLEVYSSIRETLLRAINLRRNFLENIHTTACRLVNGEGDGLPGLIIDKYGPYLVIQTGTLGMRKLIPFLIEELTAHFSIQGIYDKSTGSSLREEGIKAREEVLFGEIPEKLKIKEEGIEFYVSPKEGQKTGFFLDHREMRCLIRALSQGKKVLNAFCYTGGFSLAALTGGAAHVDSVDISESAIALCHENILLNGYGDEKSSLFKEDVFDFLTQTPCDYDLAVLDPPAFAKKKKDIPAATRGYLSLFGLAMQKMPQGSLLLLSSCSYYISETLFEEIVMKAALASKRSPRILSRHRLALDHPVNPFHPESTYLKSLLISI